MRSGKTLSLCLLLAACNAGDDTTDGARALCAEGGALDSCPAPPRTPDGVCWRLVDCAAIPLDTMNGLDWGRCVDFVQQLTDDRQRLVIDCIAASSCDALKPDPQNGVIACLALGDQ
jgi:hypothetical protein